MKKLNKKDIVQALSLIAKNAEVILPRSVDGPLTFSRWDGSTPPNLEGNSILPPKDALFPKTEKMYRYNTKSGHIEEFVFEENQVVFGIRPCDVASIVNMDKVFLEEGFIDSYYRRRREALTIISVGCSASLRTCFCDSVGGSPFDAPNADIMMNDVGEAFTVVAKSTKGEKIMEMWNELLSGSKVKPKAVSCDLKVDWHDGIPKKLTSMFDDRIWTDLSRGCLGCGICTYVCPTCYCFDIGQEVQGIKGNAFRCWDSCMFSDYTRMAGGHDPRPTKKERLRNRYMHKLSYFNDRYGSTLCVGCGRCVESCPANLDISAFIDKVGGERK